MSGIDEVKRRVAERHPVWYALGTGLALGTWGYLLFDDWILFPISFAIMTTMNWIWLRPGGRLERYREQRRPSSDAD